MQDYFEFANAFLGKNLSHENDDPERTIKAPSLAMAYVPLQKYREIYPTAIGFEKGTIFKELDKPFEGWKR